MKLNTTASSYGADTTDDTDHKSFTDHDSDDDYSGKNAGSDDPAFAFYKVEKLKFPTAETSHRCIRCKECFNSEAEAISKKNFNFQFVKEHIN